MAARPTSTSPPSAATYLRPRWILLFAGLMLVLPHGVQSSDPDCSSGPQGRYKALVCWLWKAKITLPNEQFNEEVFTISVNDMACTNFQVSSMKSSSVPSSATAPNPSVQMNLEGMSAKCTGKYALGGIGISGDIVASVSSSDGPSLHMQVDVASKPLQEQKPGNNTTPADDKASLPFPSKGSLSACNANFLVHDVQFSGSISAKVIGLFSGVISRKVTSSINENLCSLMKKNGESMLDRGFDASREYISGLILNNAVSDGISSENTGGIALNLEQMVSGKNSDHVEHLLVGSDGAVSWDKDMPFLKRILLGLNNFVSKHLNEGIILKLLQKLSTWQSMTTADCENCGFFFKGFNGLVNSLTKGVGSLELLLPEKILNFHHNHTFNIPGYGDIILTAQKVKISGIDNVTDLSLLRPDGQNLLTSSIESDTGFNISLSLGLEVRPAHGAVFQGDTLNETFEVHFTTSKVSFKSTSAWELDQEMFSRLSVGSFIYGSYSLFDNNRSVLNCVIEALSSVVLLDMQGRMNLDAMQITPIVPANEATGSPSLEDNIDELMNNVVQLLLSEYPTTTTEALVGIIETPVRNVLNDGFANLIGDTKKMPLHCVNADFPKNKSERPLRLDSNKALMLFNDLVNDESAIAGINSFISCVDNTLETPNLLNAHFYNFSVGELNVVLHDLQLENIDSVYELELLKPVDHYHLTNSFGYGGCIPTNAKDCTTTSVSFGMNLAHSKLGYLGNINVHISMKNLKLQGGAEMKFDMNYFTEVLIHDLLAHPQCASIPVTAHEFYGLNATVEMLEVNIDVNLNGQNSGPRSFTYKTEDSTQLAEVASTLMSKGTALLQETLGSEVLMQLNKASDVCDTPVNPHRSNDTKRSTGAAGLWTFLIVSAFIAGNAWLFLRGFKKDEVELVATDENAELQSGEEQPSSLSEPLLNNHDEMDENLEVETPRRKFTLSSSSLMYHPTIHPAVKYGMPASLVLTFMLFLSSNLTVGASVDLLVTKANGENLTSLINIYSFSLGSTMREMVQAGVYLLMLLILFCSGIWPYVKLVLMMYCWIASSRRLSGVKREKILYLLDSLGKFSLIDAYVLVLMMVAFRYNLEVEGVGALDVYVTPKYGFYSFLFATILSLISGHSMLYFHRQTMLPSIPVYSGRHESLSKHVFDDKHGRGLVKLTKRFRRTIILMLFLAFVLICVGVSLHSFHFTINGVAGTALGDDRVRSFSLISIGEQIPASVFHDSSSFGIYWIQTCYFFFALVMPIVCLLCMLFLFLVPMRLKQQQRVFVIAEIANAWSAIEVFAIAIIASLIEISPFSEAMVGEHCSLLNQVLSGWSSSEGDDLHYCFDVKSSIGGSSAVLIIGVLLNSLMISSLHRFAHHAIWERYEREDRPDSTEDENATLRDCVLAHTFVSKLRKRPRLGAFMFEDVSFGPHGEYSYEDEFENVAENEEAHTSNNFWSEWTKIVSVI